MNHYSTGIQAQDRIIGAHKARLECITNAIDALGRLRSEWGFAIDQLPPDVNAARDALWKAYHAELARKPDLMPPADAEVVTLPGESKQHAIERLAWERHGPLATTPTVTGAP